MVDTRILKIGWILSCEITRTSLLCPWTANMTLSVKHSNVKTTPVPTKYFPHNILQVEFWFIFWPFFSSHFIECQQELRHKTSILNTYPVCIKRSLRNHASCRAMASKYGFHSLQKILLPWKDNTIKDLKEVKPELKT